MKAGKSNLTAFFSKSKNQRYKKDEIIIRAGDTPAGVFYIKEGFVKVYSIEQNGEENLHIIYKKGELFPLIWVFKSTLKDLYYQSIGRTILQKVKRDEFLDLIKQNPRISLELFEKMTSIIDVHANRIDNLELVGSYARTIARILYLSQRFGIKKGRGVLIKVPLTHHDIATSINMTRETASREMEGLKKKGLITYRSHVIVVRDLKKLEEELVRYYDTKPL